MKGSLIDESMRKTVAEGAKHGGGHASTSNAGRRALELPGRHHTDG